MIVAASALLFLAATAHALARINARRGNAAEAKRWIAEARRILDSDPAMAEAQEQYYPYLVGYVALFTNDLKTAEEQLTRSTETLRNRPVATSASRRSLTLRLS